MVVTLQDMTPLEEMERLRAEFLGMVSHELRTPLTSIKGSAATLTEAASDLGPAEMLQFFRIIGEQADYMRDLIGDLLDVARIETGELSVAPAPAEVATLVDEARSRLSLVASSSPRTSTTRKLVRSLSSASSPNSAPAQAGQPGGSASVDSLSGWSVMSYNQVNHRYPRRNIPSVMHTHT